MSTEKQAAAYDAAQADPRKPGRPPISGETAKGHVHIRTTLARKGHWVRAARPKSLAQWATEILDGASGYERV
jgi:hypothetical protein